jgi:hypothetical protein
VLTARPIHGIEDVISEADLTDRAIFLTLAPIEASVGILFSFGAVVMLRSGYWNG